METELVNWEERPRFGEDNRRLHHDDYVNIDAFLHHKSAKMWDACPPAREWKAVAVILSDIPDVSGVILQNF
jgi:hypothetical protein